LEINTPSLLGGPSAVAPAPQARTVVLTQPPPPVLVESAAVAPGAGYVWIGGEWMWNSQWIWVAGHWGLPPYPHAVWVVGYWWRSPRGWVRVAGHWR